MSNQFDMECPNCGADSAIEIQAKVWCKLVEDGTETDGDHEWDDDSPCRCQICSHESTVRDFESESTELKA